MSWRMFRSPRQPAPQSHEELLARATALSGASISEMATALGVALPQDARRAKGFVGQLAELALGADPDAGERPDFVSLAVELKTIPVDRRGRPTEGTFCCSIALMDAEHATFESSRLRQRLARVLFLPVDGAKIAALPERRFHRPVLWTPSESELDQLRQDWEELIGRLGAGYEVTAHRGEILQVRPKGRDSRDRVLAPSSDGPRDRAPVGFYLRSRFTAELLRDRIER